MKKSILMMALVAFALGGTVNAQQKPASTEKKEAKSEHKEEHKGEHKGEHKSEKKEMKGEAKPASTEKK